MVVNIRKFNGNYTYIGREGHGHSGYFGNPSAIGKPCPQCGQTHGDAGATLPCFEAYARRRIQEDSHYANEVRKLLGQVLGCFCKPGPCHGDVLERLAVEQAGKTRILLASNEDWSDGYAVQRVLDHLGPCRLVLPMWSGSTRSAQALASERGWPDPLYLSTGEIPILPGLRGAVFLQIREDPRMEAMKAFYTEVTQRVLTPRGAT